MEPIGGGRILASHMSDTASLEATHNGLLDILLQGFPSLSCQYLCSYGASMREIIRLDAMFVSLIFNLSNPTIICWNP